MIGRVLAIARKELATFLTTPMGAVLLFVFTLLAGWWFFFLQRYFVAGQASVQGLYGAIATLHLVFAPAVTMRLWAEERRHGTYEVVMTLPVRAGEWVVGKYLAACGVLALWLASLAPAVAVVCWFGDPDPGPLWAGALGCFLLGACYLAIGCAVSALTENQIIALIAAVALSLFFYLLHHDMLRTLFPGFLGVFLHQLSLETHFQSIRRGVVDSRDLVFYLSFLVFFLYVNTALVRRRAPHPGNLVLAAGVALLLQFHAHSPVWRLDLTEERRFTLAPTTEEILAKVDPGSPVELRAFLSSEVPAQVEPFLQEVRDRLQEFSASAGDRVRLEIFDPSRSEAAAELAEDEGLKAVSLDVSSASARQLQVAYLGLVIECAEQRSALEQLPLATAALEYELSRRIAKLTRIEPLTIGFQLHDAQLEFRQRQSVNDRFSARTNFGAIRAALEDHYDTALVDLERPVPPEVRVLVVANDEKLSGVDQYHLDQFVMRGGRLMLLSQGTAAGNIGMRDGTPYVRSPVDHPAGPLFSSWGFARQGDVVLDLQCSTEPVPGVAGGTPVRMPAIPLVLASEQIDHPIYAGVQLLRVPYPSSLELRDHPEIDSIPLVRSSPQALRDGSSLLTLDPQGPGNLPDPVRHSDQYDGQFLLGALLEGRFRSPYQYSELPKELWEIAGLDRERDEPAKLREALSYRSESPLGTRMMVVGCAEFLTNQSLRVRDDGLVFFLNAVDWLAEGTDLSPLRARRFVSRAFPEPSSGQKTAGLFAGTFLVPMLWIGIGLLVYWWRRVLRPARARARHGAGDAS